MSPRTLGIIGLALAALLAVAFGAIWGRAAALAGAAAGALALALQMTAAVLARRALDGTFTTFLRNWVLGTGLRFLGVAVVATLGALAPAHFPPLPTALGFLGVLVPLLLLETRLAK